MQRSFDDAFSYGNVGIGSQAECCFGALYDGAALPIVAGKSSEQTGREVPTSHGDFVSFDIHKKDTHHVLRWPHSTDDFAVLDLQSGNRLEVIEHLETIRFEAIVEATALRKRKRGTKAKSAPVSLSINVYGMEHIANELGRKLSTASTYLQHPKALSQDKKYDNPHFFKVLEEEDMKALVGITNDSPSAQRARISDEISNILECLAEGPDDGILDYNNLKGLIAKLKPHEHDACFPVCCGGIVADVMGLGKTLTVLTSILQSISHAEIFERFDPTIGIYEGSTVRTRATLVVVSSAQLLESWRSEIERHFEPKAFDTKVFHGPTRLQDLSALASANIVLTTYATIVAEDKGNKVLQRLSWFRIVLDEGRSLMPCSPIYTDWLTKAHWIRNVASKQFKSVANLVARNRWCLTGTPIQNKLDDIATLAAFLQLQPFPTKTAFQKGVLDPLSQGGKDSSKPLRSWLRAICIRRTEQFLELPDSTQETIQVTMSQEEKQLYDQILRQSKREIDDVVSKGKSIKKYNILFTAILRMRMLCNSGTFPKRANSQKLLGSDEARETGCEQCAAFNDEDAALLLTTFQFCPHCGRSLQIGSPGSHLGSNRGSNSPLPGYSPAPSEMLSFSTGHSSKLAAVIERIRASGFASKHIVFSYWTSTLDLLSSLLDNAAMSHVQVDGRTSYTERSRRLEVFRKHDDTPVLLMSIESGSLGWVLNDPHSSLNLTAANFVHIVEPQWNPSVEEQAVARALRMGQTRQVTVIRYVVQSSVEQNILHLQKKKSSAAKFVFNLDAADELDGKLEDLKFVLDLKAASIQ
ncbi:DNA repair protein RAD5B [Colletotrichum gloeosporioides]|uniref:DNA repair protein RAD5B n=1 Tax=Colletotrichum gloeosporioides TaxID=474922 RepID=A0A8H4FN31_COLGL|nr:DNA repair protein RAD5B [Colletotrichum gloeosporioides]KAF3808323.1 DNA repair protein RAD5B [Colletotrichum gloeosporioides]